MKNKLFIVASSLSILTFAVATMSFSPMACSCLSDAQALSDLAGMGIRDRAVRNLTAENLENGLQNRWGGKTLKFGEPPLFPWLGCTKLSDSKFTCNTMIEENRLFQRGFHIQYDLASNGSLQKVAVSRDTVFSP
jgi:hypothetical protein